MLQNPSKIIHKNVHVNVKRDWNLFVQNEIGRTKTGIIRKLIERTRQKVKEEAFPSGLCFFSLNFIILVGLFSLVCVYVCVRLHVKVSVCVVAQIHFLFCFVFFRNFISLFGIQFYLSYTNCQRFDPAQTRTTTTRRRKQCFKYAVSKMCIVNLSSLQCQKIEKKILHFF